MYSETKKLIFLSFIFFFFKEFFYKLWKTKKIRSSRSPLCSFPRKSKIEENVTRICAWITLLKILREVVKGYLNKRINFVSISKTKEKILPSKVHTGYWVAFLNSQIVFLSLFSYTDSIHIYCVLETMFAILYCKTFS